MIVTNISTLRNNFSKYLDCVTKDNEKIIITTSKGNLVIISEDEFKSLYETLYLASQKELAKKIKEGEKEDINQMSVYSVKD